MPTTTQVALAVSKLLNEYCTAYSTIQNCSILSPAILNSCSARRCVSETNCYGPTDSPKKDGRTTSIRKCFHITVTHDRSYGTSWPSSKPNLPRLICAAHLDLALPQISFAIPIMSPTSYLLTWKAVPLVAFRYCSPALLAEDATSAASQRWEWVTKRRLYPSIITLHTLA